MSKKSTKQAPSTNAPDENVSGGSRAKNTKENKPMNPFFKALFGVIYLILKVSFIIAGVALVKMPYVHFIVDLPLYQVVGVIILTFLVYLELYAYFTKPAEKKSSKKEPRSALDKFKLNYEDMA